MDGAGEFEILRWVLVPLIRSGLVVHGTFIFANQYTSFLWPLAAVRDLQKQVIAVGISSLRAIFHRRLGAHKRGELVSGCGRSTILRMVADIEPCDQGEILIDGAV